MKFVKFREADISAEIFVNPALVRWVGAKTSGTATLHFDNIGVQVEGDASEVVTKLEMALNS